MRWGRKADEAQDEMVRRSQKARESLRIALDAASEAQSAAARSMAALAELEGLISDD